MNACVRVCMHMSKYVYIYIYMRTYIHKMYIYIYIYVMFAFIDLYVCVVRAQNPLATLYAAEGGGGGGERRINLHMATQKQLHKTNKLKHNIYIYIYTYACITCIHTIIQIQTKPKQI